MLKCYLSASVASKVKSLKKMLDLFSLIKFGISDYVKLHILYFFQLKLYGNNVIDISFQHTLISISTSR